MFMMKSNILFMLKKLKIEKKKTKTIFYFKLYIIVGQNHTQTHPKFLKTFQTHSKFIYFYLKLFTLEVST